jgi:hypothetical protein
VKCVHGAKSVSRECFIFNDYANIHKEKINKLVRREYYMDVQLLQIAQTPKNIQLKVSDLDLIARKTTAMQQMTMDSFIIHSFRIIIYVLVHHVKCRLYYTDLLAIMFNNSIEKIMKVSYTIPSCNMILNIAVIYSLS